MAYKGVGLRDNGSALGILRQVKSALLQETWSRFANRGLLKRLAWLDLSRWPEESGAVDAFVVPKLEAVFHHWKMRFLKRDTTLEGLKDDFARVKVVWSTASKPIEDNHAFWKAIIQNKVAFPMMHYMLRMVLALTPGDAVVEAVFNRLTQILSPHRLRLATTSVEQLLILAVDTDRWYEYDYTQALDIIRQNQRRAQFRGPRIDKGITGKRKLQATKPSTRGAAGTVLCGDKDSHEGMDSSSSSCDEHSE